MPSLATATQSCLSSLLSYTANVPLKPSIAATPPCNTIATVCTIATKAVAIILHRAHCAKCLSGEISSVYMQVHLL